MKKSKKIILLKAENKKMRKIIKKQNKILQAINLQYNEKILPLMMLVSRHNADNHPTDLFGNGNGFNPR